MNKIAVLVVHGGNANYRKDDRILTREIIKNTYSLNLGKPIFGEVLDRYLDSSKFKVFSPLFPNAIDANYFEWARFLEQVITTDILSFSNIILVGHSLGTVTLQKYLSENNLKEKFNLTVKQLHFVGCCQKEGMFETSENWEEIEKQTDNIYIYHSKDDVFCNFSEGEFYSKNLAKAEFLVFLNRGHFEMEKIPELIEKINLTY